MQITKYLLIIIFCFLLLPSYLFAINHPPIFTPPLTRGVAVGDTLTFTSTASDPDSDALSWSAENLPPGAEFNTATQTFFWIPRDTGIYQTTFSIDDGQGDLVRKIVTIKAVNRGEWFKVRTADTNEGITKVFFINDSTGWALVGYGEIFHTNDGGTIWIKQKDRDSLYSPYDLWFVDDKKGWAVGGGGAIIHTNDGGLTWNKQSSRTSKYLYDVQFVDSTTGWINGFTFILSTLDGGKTWNINRLENSWEISGFFFINRSIGWAAGSFGLILHTEDGGLTWKQQLSGTSNHLGKIQFIDSSQGWVVGKNGTILFTKDGGITWNSQNSGVTQYIIDIKVITNKIGWVLTSGMQLLHSIDGGNTWSVQLSNVGNLYDIVFINLTSGWIIGDRGKFFKTSDGGVTWVNQTNTSSTKLKGIHFTDSKNGWAVGYDGVIVHTKDGGTGWQQLQFDSVKEFTNVQFVDSLSGWITYGPLYERGGIFHTSDGGITWTAQNTQNPHASHLGLDFLNADTGWVTGDEGMLAYTTDGGNTWINKWQGSDRAIFVDVDFVNSRNGWIAASEDPSREIISTSDGGANWSTIITPLSLLTAVNFTDTLNGWAAGWGGSIGHTSDGGKTWVRQNSGISEALFDVHFVDPLTGWAVGESGTIIQTNDGGETWTIQTSGTTGRLNAVYFSDPTTGWVVGEFGTILKIRRDDEHLIKPDIPYQTTIASQSTPVLISFSNGGGLKIQFTEGSVAGKSLSATYTQKAPSVVPSALHFNKPAYYVDFSTPAENYKANLVLKYTDDLVHKQGIKEPELAAAYWNAKDSLWKSVPVSIDTSANSVTLTTSHLSLWALVSSKKNLITGIDNAADENALPLTYALYQNYPNPFNPVTIIRFQTPQAGITSIRIYNILGQEVKTVISGQLPEGMHEVKWDGTDKFGNKVASGIYLYRMESSTGFVKTRKMVYIK